MTNVRRHGSSSQFVITLRPGHKIQNDIWSGRKKDIDGCIDEREGERKDQRAIELRPWSNVEHSILLKL